MNLKVLQWLLRNQAVLLKVVALAKSWKKDAPYAEQWAIVDSIARLIIPLLENGDLTPQSLTEYVSLGVNDSPERAEVSALALDWQFLSQTVLPLVIAILKLLAEKA